VRLTSYGKAVDGFMDGLYFDHAASTPPDEEVIRAVSEVMRSYYGNPSSLHSAGAAAEKLLKQAAQVIASSWKAHPDEIVFTSGGTESNNLAIFGAADAFSNRGKHLITSTIEHPSVYECFKRLERLGYEVTYINPDESGAVRTESVTAALRDDTILVSLMAVNNETGRIQPFEEVGAMLADRPRTLFHVDAVQAAGKLPLTPAAQGIDLMSISAHKLHGPRGAGALYVRSGIQLTPLLYGGGQQNGLRPGTEHVPIIVGMAKAVRLASDQLSDNVAHMRRLSGILRKRLSDADTRIRLTGTSDAADMSSHIVHFLVLGLRAEVLLHALEREGFLVSSQSACSSGDKGPSRVLLAMGMDEEEAKSGIRISLCRDHSVEDVERLADALIQATAQLWKWME
jgi:cysteine desulfurase